MSTPRETFQTQGHSAHEQSLLSLIERKQLPQTLLFHGPKGVGKATFAFQLACYLFGGAAADAGGLFGDVTMSIDKEAPPVRRVMAGSHADLLVIEPELSGQNQNPIIKVDAARKAAEFLSKTASESQWRVVIIDGAEALNINAANALLKVVEEPPLNAVMILIAHQPGKLLPTLLSRCRKYAFSAISKDIFQSVASESLSNASDELYVLSYGAPGEALALAEMGAPAIYHQMLALFSHYPAYPADQLSSLISSAEKLAKQGGWGVWCRLWLQMLTRVNLAACDSLEDSVNAEERHSFELMIGASQSTDWQALLSSSRALIGRAGALHLDRKQVITSLVDMAFHRLELAA